MHVGLQAGFLSGLGKTCFGTRVLLCLLLAGCLFSRVGHPRGVSLGGLPEHNTPDGRPTQQKFILIVLEA